MLIMFCGSEHHLLSAGDASLRKSWLVLLKADLTQFNYWLDRAREAATPNHPRYKLHTLLSPTFSASINCNYH